MNSTKLVRRRCRTAVAVAAVIGGVVSITGCSTGIGGRATPGELDVRTLDVGGMATEPFDRPMPGSHSFDHGIQLATMRLADHTITGRDIDPALKYSLISAPTRNGSSYDLFWAPGLQAPDTSEVLEREKMLFGYTYQATDSADQILWGEPRPAGAEQATITVLQFPDEQTATRSAQEITDAEFNTAADNQAVTLPAHRQANTFQEPNQPDIESTLAHGSYVVNLVIRGKSSDPATLSTLADNAYTAELPMLDGLPPLSSREILVQDNDSNGMLRRTLQAGTILSPRFADEATFGLQGYLHSQHDVEWTAGVMTAAGADAFGYSDPDQDRTITTRTRDDAAASNLLNALAGQPGLKPAITPTQVPDAHCFEDTAMRDNRKDRIICFVRYRRYVATIRSRQPVDADQRAAAQYALLANSQ
ncbi:DUF7373 family lipoprotein [Nocardia niigatensis]